MKQTNVILKAMLDNPTKKIWTAKDFQSGQYFVGYEATARMSEIANMYQDIIIVGKEGRFRTLSIDWGKEKEINDLKKILEEINNGNSKQ